MFIHKLNEKFEEFRVNWQQLVTMNREKIPLMVYTYRPYIKRDIELQKNRCGFTEEGGIGILPIP